MVNCQPRFTHVYSVNTSGACSFDLISKIHCELTRLNYTILVLKDGTRTNNSYIDKELMRIVFLELLVLLNPGNARTMDSAHHTK